MNKKTKFENAKKTAVIFIAGVFLVFLLFPKTAYAATDDKAYVTETLLNQDPDPAEPGKYLELRWQVLKEGDKNIDQLIYDLDAVYPFSFDGSDSQTKVINNWSGTSDEDEYYVLYYKVKVADDAIEGDYDLTLKSTTINNGEAVEKKVDYTIRVGDKTRPDLLVGAISTTPKKLVSDTDEGTIAVEIENIGNDDAYNVYAELVLPNGFTTTYSYSDVDSIGTISAGGSKTAVFYVDVDKSVASGLHAAQINLRYKEDLDKTDYYNAVIPVNLSIISSPVFEIVSVKSSPEKIAPGDTVELTLQIKNAGGKDAESVSVKAYKESSQPFNFDEKSDFIGSLNAGETGEAVIKFTVDKDAVPKKHIMDLEIRSINENNVVLDEISIPVEISAGSDSAFAELFSSKNVLIVVLLLAVIFLGYRLYQTHN